MNYYAEKKFIEEFKKNPLFKFIRIDLDKDENGFTNPLVNALYSGYIYGGISQNRVLSTLRSALFSKLEATEYDSILKEILSELDLENQRFESICMMQNIIEIYNILNTHNNMNGIDQFIEGDEVFDVLVSNFNFIYNGDVETYFKENKQTFLSLPVTAEILLKLGYSVEAVKGLYSLFGDDVKAEVKDIPSMYAQGIKELRSDRKSDREAIEDLEKLKAKRKRVIKVIRDIGGIKILAKLVKDNEKRPIENLEDIILTGHDTGYKYCFNDLKLLVTEIAEYHLNNPLRLSMSEMEDAIRLMKESIAKLELSGREMAKHEALLSFESDNQTVHYSISELEFMMEMEREVKGQFKAENKLAI